MSLMFAYALPAIVNPIECFFAIFTKNEGPSISVEKVTLYNLSGFCGSKCVVKRFSSMLPLIILLKPKKLREFLGAYKNVLSKTSPTDNTFRSHFNFESAIE